MASKILIVGGGASGYMAAITAAAIDRDLQVLIAEKTLNTLSKVRISGGGRCNVTHQPYEVDVFAQNYPRGHRFLKKILYEFGPDDTIQWFERRGVALKTETDGRMFPVSNKSESIINCLQQEVSTLGVEVKTKYGVEHFELEKKNGINSFKVTFSDGTIGSFDKVLIATGGYPKASGFDWIRSHELEISDPAPSLFTFNSPSNPICSLLGVAVSEARIKILGSKLEWAGPLLITHWGFSGPAILKLSAWGARILKERDYNFEILINWISNIDKKDIREELTRLRDNKSKALVSSNSKFNLPGRLWKFLVIEAGISEEKIWADLSNKALESLIIKLTEHRHQIKGKTTFKEEFVTCGGISLSAIDHNTMESKKIKGLYFSGEVIDVDGITGGFNFQNAWSTGFTAGKAMASEKSLSD
ncbi:MAG: NAD(P)/FAD-dependent oxidoreductase [Saprospiraceae bacterium]|nr:NAD(P)/FAD-dependent oxidoreductase [Candidatus Brachybacter algidus]MBL0118712.1 NAD(P)/FAD-dependent oxidoreductase [Candidatus Brachybacter algidus]